MLVVQRKKNEKLFIGRDITIVVTEIQGNRVSIGIDAPKDVAIVRDDANERKRDIDTGSGNV